MDVMDDYGTRPNDRRRSRSHAADARDARHDPSAIDEVPRHRAKRGRGCGRREGRAHRFGQWSPWRRSYEWRASDQWRWVRERACERCGHVERQECSEREHAEADHFSEFNIHRRLYGDEAAELWWSARRGGWA